MKRRTTNTSFEGTHSWNSQNKKWSYNGAYWSERVSAINSYIFYSTLIFILEHMMVASVCTFLQSKCSSLSVKCLVVDFPEWVSVWKYCTGKTYWDFRVWWKTYELFWALNDLLITLIFLLSRSQKVIISHNHSSWNTIAIEIQLESHGTLSYILLTWHDGNVFCFLFAFFHISVLKFLNHSSQYVL